VTITLLLRWSLGHDNRAVPSRWRATPKQTDFPPLVDTAGPRESPGVGFYAVQLSVERASGALVIVRGAT